MAKVETHIRILAEDDPRAPDGVRFRMQDWNGCNLGLLVFNKKQLSMRKEDEHDVHFHLVQTKGMTLEFAQSPAVALWVDMGDEHTIPVCPTSQPPTQDPIFFATQSTPRKLKATNLNPAEQYFSFTLNFVDPKSSTPTKLIPFDPGGSNQNSGITRSYDALIGGVAGAVAGALAANLTFDALAANATIFYALVGASIGALAAIVLRDSRDHAR